MVDEEATAKAQEEAAKKAAEEGKEAEPVAPGTVLQGRWGGGPGIEVLGSGEEAETNAAEEGEEAEPVAQGAAGTEGRCSLGFLTLTFSVAPVYRSCVSLFCAAHVYRSDED